MFDKYGFLFALITLLGITGGLPAPIFAETPASPDGFSPDKETSKEAAQPSLLWGELKFPAVGYATGVRESVSSSPVVGIGIGMTVKPWDTLGIQGRAHLNSEFRPFADPVGGFNELALMAARIESNDSIHWSFGAGLAYMSGKTAGFTSGGEDTAVSYKTVGLGGEAQFGVHLGRNISFTTILMTGVTLENSYVAFVPTLQLGGFY